jgi:hypothetical protein
MFVIKNENHACCICLDVYREPQYLPCGHNLCLECAKQLLGKPCPICRSSITTFNRNIDLEFDIISSEVHCPNKRFGCDLHPNIISYEDHVSKCEYRSIQCTSGCGYEAVSLADHTAQDCIAGFRVLLDASHAKLKTSEGIAEQRRQEVEQFMVANDILVLERDLARHEHISAQQDADYLIEENLELEDRVEDFEEENTRLEEENEQLEAKNGRLVNRVERLVTVANQLREGVIRGQEIISRKF